MVENRPWLTFLSHAVLVFGVLCVAFPLYVTFIASTLSLQEVMSVPMPLLPGSHLVENYSQVLGAGTHTGSKAAVSRMLFNSLVMALVIPLGKITISIIASFAIVYFRFRGRMFFFWMIFITLMLPVEVRIIPTLQVITDLKMDNTYAGLTIPLIASATATFLFRQFFMTIPDELAEAARVDGAGPMRFFWDVLMPLSKTTMAALFVIQFIYGWNQYLWPLLVATDESMYTTVIGIKRMIVGSDAANEWNLIMATAILAMLPPALVVVLMQKWFVKGLVETEKIMAAVSLRDVRKSYTPELQVIHGVSMEIADGEFIVILGPSGCGKSTLLRMVAGLETISAGEIAIGGKVVNRLEPKDRDIAMVFQNYALYPHMSVYDNMAYGLRIGGLSKEEIDTRVQNAAAILELGKYLDRKPRALSGGQRQRVAMGRAIVREPKVFLFDEPLSNLDAKLRVQMRGELQSLHRRLGTTSLYVTHDQVEAMTLAQRMIVMNGGRAEQVGAPLEVYAKPASTFVASFIGSPPMNLIPRDGKILGVRPEHLEPCAASQALLTIQVDLVEPLGADTLVYGHVDGNTGEARVVVRLSAAAAVPQGTLPLRYSPANMHWFDAATGKRLDA